MSRNNTAGTGRALVAKAAGIATTAAAGALAMAIAAPHAAAEIPAEAPSSLQSTIDQLLDAMQAAAAADSALPFASPQNNELLPDLMQNLVLQQLLLALHAQHPDGLFSQIPDVMNGAASNVRQWALLNNPDVFYNITQGLDPDASYVISGTFSEGSAQLSVNTNAIGATGSTTIGSLELESGLKINPDGTFTISVAPEKPDGAVNYVSDDGANYLLVRSTMGDWAAGPSTVTIECVAHCPEPTPGVGDGGLSPEAIQSALANVLAGMPRTNATAVALAQQGGIVAPDNTMSPFKDASTGVIGAAAAQYNSAGSFDLQPGQALIVKVPDVDAGYSGINLYTAWGQTLPYPLAINSYNDTQAFHAADGYTYYVVSATNPGVANWLDTGGLTNGAVYARILGLPADSDLQGLPVSTEVVPVDEVSDYLPADTPTVSPAEYAATMTERVLTYDYAMDLARTADTSWVTEQLWLHDLETTMGSEDFEAVFGVDPTTPMWLRFTPALSPDWTAVTKDVLTDPSAGFAAFNDNLALAQHDINLPIQLAQALLQRNFDQTFEAVQTHLGSGQWLQALTDLQLGGQQFGSILSDALFDPHTSITAGILNARDDLATAILAANGGFPAEAGWLSTLQWALMPQLTDLDADSQLSDITALFNSAFAELGSLF